jgi:hypothetical protein
MVHFVDGLIAKDAVNPHPATAATTPQSAAETT